MSKDGNTCVGVDGVHWLMRDGGKERFNRELVKFLRN
jgi:hypothetical protein